MMAVFSPLRRHEDRTAEEVALVHAVLEGFAAVDEDHGNLVVEAAAQVFCRVNIDLAPLKAAPALQFGKRFLNHLAQVAALAGVKNHVFGGGGHQGVWSGAFGRAMP
jgi:hypothetical protein